MKLFTDTTRRGVTLAAVCGQRWPRLLPTELAAAYLGMSRHLFQEDGECMEKALERNGRLFWDREDLDALVERWKEEKTTC